MANQNSNGNVTTTTTSIITSSSTVPLVISIVKKEVELIKPSKPTPSDIVLSFSTIDNNANFETLTPSIFVYSKKKPQLHSSDDDDDDPASVIKEALSKALVHYYPLAGRLKRHVGDGKLRLTCNRNGVPFLEAAADCPLASLNYFDGIDLEVAKQFVFASPPADCPLVFQVTKFSCGGFVIGFGMSHSVCDGIGVAQFFKAVSELSKGKKDITVKPVWERERLLGKPATDLVEFFKVDETTYAVSPHLPSSDISHEFFSVKPEALKRLKEGLATTGESFTTIEALGAYVWRARVRALELNPNGKTFFMLTTNIRKLVSPPLPEGYYGNAFVPSTAELSGKDINDRPLKEIAELIKAKKKEALSCDFVRKTVDTLETLIAEPRQNVKMAASGAKMLLTDWRNLEMMEGEVGLGWEVVNITTLPWDMFGYVDLCFFLSPSKSDPSMKGGVRVLVSLPSPAVAKFKEEMDSI